MIIGYITLFGWVGYRLFRGTQQGELYFSTLLESIWSMLILLTTSNFPDVMILSFRINRIYALFFIFYLVFGMFFLLNLVLAIYYSNYKSRIDESIHKFVTARGQFLNDKFDFYDKYNCGFLSPKEFKEMIIDIFQLDKDTLRRINLDRVVKKFSK